MGQSNSYQKRYDIINQRSDNEQLDKQMSLPVNVTPPVQDVLTESNSSKDIPPEDFIQNSCSDASCNSTESMCLSKNKSSFSIEKKASIINISNCVDSVCSESPPSNNSSSVENVSLHFYQNEEPSNSLQAGINVMSPKDISGNHIKWDQSKSLTSFKFSERNSVSFTRVISSKLGTDKVVRLDKSLKDEPANLEKNEKQTNLQCSVKKPAISITSSHVSRVDKDFDISVNDSYSVADILTDNEIEIAWLHEVFQHLTGKSGYNWEFIEQCATSDLKSLIRETRETAGFDSVGGNGLQIIVRLDYPLVKESFMKVQELCRNQILSKLTTPFVSKISSDMRSGVSRKILQLIESDISASDEVNGLSKIETEIVWLIEAIVFLSTANESDLIKQLASNELSMALKKAYSSSKVLKLHNLIELQDPFKKVKFTERRKQVKRKLKGLFLEREDTLSSMNEIEVKKLKFSCNFSPHWIKLERKSISSRVYKRGEEVYLFKKETDSFDCDCHRGVVLGCKFGLNSRSEYTQIYSIMFDDNSIDSRVHGSCVFSEQEIITFKKSV